MCIRDSITWEGRSCNSYPVEGSGRGFIIYGDKGTLVNYGRGDYKVYDTTNKLVKEIKADVKSDPNNTVSASGDADMYHQLNFIESIRGDAKVTCLLYTSPSPRDRQKSRMPSSA